MLTFKDIQNEYPDMTKDQIRYIIRKHNIKCEKDGNKMVYPDEIKLYIEKRNQIKQEYISSIEIHQLFHDVSDKQLYSYLKKKYVTGIMENGVYLFHRIPMLSFLYCRYTPKTNEQHVIQSLVPSETQPSTLDVKWTNKGLQIYKEGSNHKTFKQLCVRAINYTYMMDVINKLKQIFPHAASEIDKISFIYEKKGSSEYDDELMIPYTDIDVLYQTPIMYLLYTEDTSDEIQQLLLCMKYPRIHNNSLWYPYKPFELTSLKNSVCISKEAVEPKYPIYIISKGRADTQKTSTFLDKCGIKHFLVVEPKEFQDYYKNVKTQVHTTLLKTPENFSERKNGGIPVRNWVWQHSVDAKHKRHWILDDNITKYERLDRGQKTEIQSGAIFRHIEDYVDSFTNVKMAGHNYSAFVVSSRFNYPVTKNTRIYSSILLSNDIYPEFAWRGTYNEDTDLSLRILKAGYPTVLFNRLVACKLRTMVLKGGNTDTIYAVQDAHALKTRELVNNHSDVASETVKFSRIHHNVNYTKFKDNKLDSNLEAPTFDKTYNLYYQI